MLPLNVSPSPLPPIKVGQLNEWSGKQQQAHTNCVWFCPTKDKFSPPCCQKDPDLQKKLVFSRPGMPWYSIIWRFRLRNQAWASAHCGNKYCVAATDVGKSLTNFSPPFSNPATSIHPRAPTNTQLVSPSQCHIEPHHSIVLMKNMQWKLSLWRAKHISKRISKRCVGC